MLQKIQTIYICSKCDAQFPKWSGRCLECGSWGTIEVQSQKLKVKSLGAEIPIGEVKEFDKIKGKDVARIKTGIGELDRVLGGGIVPGSLVLLGGEPGIGKSTLVLQIAEKVTQINLRIFTNEDANSAQGKNSKFEIRNSSLYISGEESAEQIKMRIDRLNIESKNLQFLGETDIETICATIDKKKPCLAIIDSIQTMYFSDLPSEPGSVNQVRACTVKLLEVAKRNNLPIFITGHVTKEGAVAGPKTLEHLVDTVLYLEGDQHHFFRLLRSVKNRFGSTNEVGVFEMGEKGLAEVKNPSEAFLQERGQREAGSVITAVMEGSRAFLVEVQALVNRSYFGYPQRKTSGFDYNRLALLIAVLTQRCKLPLGNQDVHLNLAGGIRINEPAIDLAVCLAVISAFKNRPIDPKLVAFGEVGLGGEVRSVAQTEKRLAEAEKLGFNKIIMPEIKLTNSFSRLQINRIRYLTEAMRLF
jgi:DNA repair protein RadA/Sms